MRTNWLFVVAAVIGVGVGTGAAGAATISFLEDPFGTAPIGVHTDISGGVITTTVESATFSLGNVTGASTSIIAKALIQPGSMQQERGGMGVSDILDLFTFLSPSGGTIGFQAVFQSDEENGLNTPGDLTPPDIVETGSLQPIFTETVTLPGVGPANLTVNVQSDVDVVPEPSMLVLTVVGLLAFDIMRRGTIH